MVSSRQIPFCKYNYDLLARSQLAIFSGVLHGLIQHTYLNNNCELPRARRDANARDAPRMYDLPAHPHVKVRLVQQISQRIEGGLKKRET